MTLKNLQNNIKKTSKNNNLENQNADTPFHQTKPIPPLAKWSPEHHDIMDLQIRADGSWWHEGARMTRQSLVDLFATVLWSKIHEQDGVKTQQFYLKTPVEQIQISVADVPLLAIDVQTIEHEGASYLEFATQTGDYVVASKAHPIVMRNYEGQMRPYIMVRNSGAPIDALIHRNTFFHLVNMGNLT